MTLQILPVDFSSELCLNMNQLTDVQQEVSVMPSKAADYLIGSNFMEVNF